MFRVWCMVYGDTDKSCSFFQVLGIICVNPKISLTLFPWKQIVHSYLKRRHIFKCIDF